MQRLPVTLALSAYALVLTLVIGLLSGIVAALRQNTWIDQVAMVLAMLGISLPSFYLGLLMIIFFAVDLRWLPTGGYIALTDDPVDERQRLRGHEEARCQSGAAGCVELNDRPGPAKDLPQRLDIGRPPQRCGKRRDRGRAT